MNGLLFDVDTARTVPCDGYTIYVKVDTEVELCLPNANQLPCSRAIQSPNHLDGRNLVLTPQWSGSQPRFER